LAGPASGTPAAASNASGAAAVAPVTGASGSQASGAPAAAASNTSSGAAVVPAASTSGSQAGGADASVASAATPGANAPGPGGSDVSGATATARSNAPGATATATASATSGPNTPGANSPGAPATATASAAAPVWTVSVPDISVNGFKVSAEDRQVTPALALTLSPIDIHVAGYNTTPAARLDITAKTTVNGSSTLSATAQLSPSGAGDTTAHIDLAQFDLAMFQPFIAQRTAMTLQSGKLTTQLDIKKTADGVLSAKGDVDLTGVKSVDELQQSFIRWKDLRVAGIQYNSQPASLQIATVTAQGAYARIIIAPDRTVNVVQVLAGPSKGTPGVATQLGAASAKAGGVSVAGVTGGAPGQAAALHADVKAAKKDAKEEAKEAKAGVANATAPGAPAPGAAKPGETAAEAAAPEANVSGAAAPGATASGAAAPEGNVPGSAAPGVTASGAAAPQANAPVAANSGGTSPQAPASPAAAQGAAPDTAATAAAKSGKHRGRKSGSNAPGGTTVASTQSSAPAMPMSIDTIRIMDGSVNYADFWIQPNFAVGIQMLNGTIEGLSSDPKSRAKVKLEGKVDRYAPVTITGEMNVLAAAVYTDIDMSFKGLELTTMTPYSGHFAGYKIDKGKLSVDLSYKIDQRKLNAEQHFVIDQLQLGDAVDSPDAVHLPLKLAVALLKDRNGVIDLPLPITGSLDDPQFKVGPIIWHAVVNLLEKAVTAPFAAIGHLFGGHGEELKYVDFTAGSADLDDASKQKLDALTKALEEHDQLQLDVPLVYSQDLDAPVLAKRTLTLRLIARAHGGKLPPAVQQALASQQNAAGQNAPPGQQVAGSQPAPAGQHTPAAPAPAAPPLPTDPALTDPLQHYRLLLAEYQAELGKDTALPASATAIQNAKSKKDTPPVESAIPDLENALIGQIDVPDLQLQDLAKRRTRAIQDALLADGGINAARVFIINGTAKTDDNGKVRVEMALK
jgi:hypothetical protein